MANRASSTSHQSLASIDFDDFEPTMDAPDGDNLATCAYFKTDRKSLAAGETLANPRDGRFSIVSVAAGELESADGRHFGQGRFLLLPRGAAPLQAVHDSTVLQITLPRDPSVG